MAENTIDFQPYLPRATYKVFRKTCGPPPLKPHVSLEDYEDFARTSLERPEGLGRIWSSGKMRSKTDKDLPSMHNIKISNDSIEIGGVAHTHPFSGARHKDAWESRRMIPLNVDEGPVHELMQQLHQTQAAL